MSRVVVTRPRERAGDLVERLRELGHDVVVCPLVSVERLGDDPIDSSAFDWVVLTSRTGVREFARRRVGRLPRVAAIGPGTASELRAVGIEPDLIANVSTQEGLAAAMPRPAGRVLLAAAESARQFLREEFDADFLPLYQTVELEPKAFPAADLVVLASPSAARAFARLGVDAAAVSIGPQTTQAAAEAGVRIVREAATHDLDGVVAAVGAACRDTVGTPQRELRS